MISKVKPEGERDRMEQNQMKWIGIERDVAEFFHREYIISATKELSISANKS